jgi:hypothetical protein
VFRDRGIYEGGAADTVVSANAEPGDWHYVREPLTLD